MTSSRWRTKKSYCFVRAVCSVTIATRGAVVRPRHDQQVEVFICLDQPVNDLHRRRRIDIRIHLTDNQQQLTLQTMRVIDIRRELRLNLIFRTYSFTPRDSLRYQKR